MAIDLDPSQVRLHPTRDDAYRWKVLPEKHHLFEKNLSDLSIGAYKELYDGVGVTFEAVRVTCSTLSESFYGQVTFVRCLSPSLERLPNSIQNAASTEPVTFTSRINELQVQNDYMTQQLNFVKFQLEAEIKLRLTLEDKLQVSHDRQEAFRQDLQKADQRETYFRNAALKYSQVLAKLEPILSELQQDPPVTEFGCI